MCMYLHVYSIIYASMCVYLECIHACILRYGFQKSVSSRWLVGTPASYSGNLGLFSWPEGYPVWLSFSLFSQLLVEKVP